MRDSESPAAGKLGRRVVLGGLAGALAVPAPVLGAPNPSSTAGQANSAARPYPERGMTVVLLGTAGGPPPHADRAGISSALVVDRTVYLVDVGRAAVTQYARSGLKWADLRGLFITHLHADHVADYFNVFLLGGNVSPAQSDSLPGSTPVYGPGPAGGLPPTFGGGTSPTTNPADPTPGILGLTNYCANAYAYGTNLFMRDSHIRETRGLIDVQEITLPAVGATYQNPAPAMAPFVVMEDDRVRVTAVLVPHGPAFPAFAYRFDTDYGSVTFSGDTTYSDNLLTLAHRTDLLVHEAINVVGFNGPAAVIDHLLAGHVEVQKVGAVARKAEARRLVLSHVGDLAANVIDEKQWTRWAGQGFSGPVHVGRDLERFRIR